MIQKDEHRVVAVKSDKLQDGQWGLVTPDGPDHDFMVAYGVLEPKEGDYSAAPIRSRELRVLLAQARSPAPDPDCDNRT